MLSHGFKSRWPRLASFPKTFRTAAWIISTQPLTVAVLVAAPEEPPGDGSKKSRNGWPWWLQSMDLFFLRFMKFTAWFYIYICMFYLCWLKEWFWYVLMFWYGIYINGHIVQKRMVTQRLECDYLYCTNAENWTNKNGNATLINGHLSDWTNNMQRFEQPKSKHKAKQVWSRSKHFRPRGTTDQ